MLDDLKSLLGIVIIFVTQIFVAGSRQVYHINRR